MLREHDVSIKECHVESDQPESDIDKFLFLDINEVPLTREGISDFYWPVNPFEVSDLYLTVLRNVISVLRKAVVDDLPGVNAGVVLYPYFLQELMSFYEAHLLISRSSRDGYVIASSNDNRLLPLLSHNNKSFSSRILDQLFNGPPLPKLWRAPLRFIRDIIVAPKEGLIRRSLIPLDYKKNIVSIRLDDLVTSCARSIKERVYFRRSNTWFKHPSSTEVLSFEAYSELTRRLLKCVNASFSLKSKGLPKEFNDYFDQWLKTSIPLVEHYYSQLDKHRNRVPERLWVGTAGELWGRILTRYIKSHGGHITRYAHGNTGHFLTSIEHGVYEFEDCDTYITSSKNQAAAFKAAFTGEDVVQETPPEIIHVEADLLEIEKISKNNFLTKKQTVMYVAPIYPGVYFRAASKGGMRDYVLLDWEVRLINKLREWDRAVLLKPHPVESLCIAAPASINRLFGSITLSGRFEELYDQADVILIDNPQTSLFSTLIRSGIPFVYLNFDIAKFSDHAYSLLMKRCPIVKGWYDNNNRAQVDWDQLREAIEACHEYSDDGFSRFYFDNL